LDRKILINRLITRIFIIVLCHFVYLICGDSSGVFAQNQAENIQLAAIEEGFENVSVYHKNDTLQVFVENRRYRFDPRGLAELIKIVDRKNDSKTGMLDIILLRNEVPMLRLTFPFAIYEQYLFGEIDMEKLLAAISATLNVSTIKQPVADIKNRSRFKVDVAVLPKWSAKFGNFDNPVESNISLIPELKSTLARGLTLRAQLIIPVQNDFFFVAERETVRPGNITLNQFVSLDDNFYLDFTTGFFDKNRAGIDLEVKKLFAEGQFQIGANVGYTGYYSFTGIQTEYYDKQRYLTAILNAQYRYNPFDLVARLEVGNFLYNVLSARFEVLRQFGQVKIGFFAFATKDNYDGGFRFSIPLPPGKYTKLRIFRIRPSEAFDWEYRAKGFPQNGVKYQTGYSLTDMLLDYNPDFVKKRLIIEIDKLSD
jgi:hypothetical protein